jgi:hypothetical protein
MLRLYESLLNNPYFPKPFIDLHVFKSKIDEYSDAITAAMGGAKIAFAQRDSLRGELTGMFLQLVSYVEGASNNDPAVFASSGLESIPNAHRPPEMLDTPRIRKIEHGEHSGELLVTMPPSHRKIMKYDLRYVPVDASGVPTADWTELPFPSAQRPASIQGLNPGTVYAFQIRVYGALGYTEWSNSVTKMCT